MVEPVKQKSIFEEKQRIYVGEYFTTFDLWACIGSDKIKEEYDKQVDQIKKKHWKSNERNGHSKGEFLYGFYKEDARQKGRNATVDGC